jgi:hypothetical protein
MKDGNRGSGRDDGERNVMALFAGCLNCISQISADERHGGKSPFRSNVS